MPILGQSHLAPTSIEHWQPAMAGMLTAATGTKMDTAKTFQVNTTVSPDVIIT